MAEKREQSPRIEDDTNVDEELQQMQARLLQMEAEKNAVRRVHTSWVILNIYR